jgi:hypothetical protein
LKPALLRCSAFGPLAVPLLQVLLVSGLLLPPSTHPMARL